MHLAELIPQIVFGLLLLFVRLAEFSNQSGVFRQAGDNHSHKFTIADLHHGAQIVHTVEASAIRRQQTELTCEVIQPYRECFAFFLWSCGVPFVWFSAIIFPTRSSLIIMSRTWSITSM